ncbi:MAG: GyrI-like domain-containing protein [Thermomicrobiales bacterium]|nr:GyrI-like domain-containing protein [Thermomicrobiales bacterium]MCO5229444.1 GyrI-like domain-containing protein [Thermomicrobiales bacterium]
MPTLDFKKTQRSLYRPSTTPGIVDVPPMTFIMVDGAGDPNTSADYAASIEVLYGLSYTIKMSPKSGLLIPGFYDYVVLPLEGLWDVADATFTGGVPVADKSLLRWTSMIRQPEFVTTHVFELAKTTLTAKKPGLDLSLARLEQFTEGLCVQAMHLGPFDEEPATISRMDVYAVEQGFRPDMANGRRHHEIYLSDPRRTAPEKLKTVVRHPIAALD